MSVLPFRRRPGRVEAAAPSVRAGTLSLRRARSGTVLETAQIDPVLLGDAYGRDAAMSVPAIAGCRNLICGTVAQLDVDRIRGDERIEQGQLLTQPDPDVAWLETITATVDDLLFYGRAYWLVLARDSEGYPTRARCIPATCVEPELSSYLTDYSRLLGYRVNGTPLEPGDVIAFGMTHNGVLNFGARTIASAIASFSAARRFADVEIPAGVLINEGHELSQSEADDLVENFQAQRRTKSVAYLQGVKYERTNISPADLQLSESLSGWATECCRLFNVPVVMIGASPTGHTGSSVLYSNVGQNTAAYVGTAVSPVLAAIEQALSGPYVTPRGQRVIFQVGQYVRSDPTAAVEYVTALVDKQIISVDEARGVLGIPPVAVGGTVDEITPGRV
jgi:HK97 family phage portal protein